MPELWGRLAINSIKREIYLAYSYLLKAQIYSFEGKLLKEVPIAFKAMESREKENLRNINGKTQEGPVWQVIDVIKATDNGFMVLKTYPRIEFKEYDYNGNIINCYWHFSNWDTPPAKDFIITDIAGSKRKFIICYEGKYQPIEVYEEK